MADSVLRVPPNNIEAEQSTLGAMLLEKEACERGLELLVAEDFYRPSHQEIFKSLQSLILKGIAVDIISITEELTKQKKLEVVGGADYLVNLLDIVPTAANIDYYIKIVEEKSRLRKLINASTKISSLAYDPESDVEDITETSEKLIFEVAEGKTGENFKDIKSLVMDTWDWINKRFENKGVTAGLSTGFSGLDRLTSGLQPGELVVLAARPAMGKTSLALNIALNAAIKSKSCVAVFSLEMGAELLTQRMVCSQAQANMQHLKNGTFETDELNRIVSASSAIYETNIYIDDSTDISPLTMRAKARRLKAQQGRLDLIVVDYLQLMKSPEKVRDNRQLEVSMIARGLKNLARELKCPVIALSQLSRAVENRTDKRPMLSDLRESGAIEADADIVLMLYRGKYYEKQEQFKKEDDVAIEENDYEEAELIIAKHRNGATGTINLGFKSRYVTFFDIEKRYDEVH